MKEKCIVGLSLCLLLSGCTTSTTASSTTSASQTKASTSQTTIDVSASTTDEVETLAVDDVSDTIQSLNDKRDEISNAITDFDSYTQNVDKIEAYYEDTIKETEELGVRLREYAYKYAQIIIDSDSEYKDKYKDLKGLYEYVYDDAAKSMYDIYDKTIQEMYSTYYDGIIQDAYDSIEYSDWYDAKSDAYDDWLDTKSDVYDIWSDVRSDIYDFYSDIRTEVYDKDEKRINKKMEKFKKDIIRMKEKS